MQPVNRHPNGTPPNADRKPLKMLGYMPGGWGPDRRRSGPHPERLIANKIRGLQKIREGSRLGADSQALLDKPFGERRAALEALFATIDRGTPFLLSKATSTQKTAQSWLKQLGKGLDGIVAKRLDLMYRPGVRAMQKYKVWQTVDCVVGGVYCQKNALVIEYLLMGLFDETGQLHYIGRCRAQSIPQKELAARLVSRLGRGGFTGKQPGGESRWTGDKREAIPVEPDLVAEVSADHIENGRFRHGSRFVRWRPDKDAAACSFDRVLRI